MKSWLLLFLFCFPSLLWAGQISVQGEASQKVTPDYAIISLSATGRDIDVEKARKQAEKKLDTILNIAKKLAIPRDKIAAEAVSITPDWRDEPVENLTVNDVYRTRRVLKGYDALITVTITMKDISKVGNFIAEATQAGVDRMNGVSFGVNDNAALNDAVLKEAVQNAMAKAKLIATTAGVTLGTLETLNVGNVGSYYPQGLNNNSMMMQRASDASPSIASATEVPTGKIVVSASVSASFNVKDDSKPNTIPAPK